MLPTSASTGRPASRARVSVGAPSGSTPTSRTREPYQPAMPESSPPPPTPASTVSSSGAWASSSSATVPWPRMVSS